MDIELSFYPVGSGYGATLKAESGSPKVYLDGTDPLDAIVGVLCSSFCSNKESQTLLHPNVEDKSEKPMVKMEFIGRPQRATNFSVAL